MVRMDSLPFILDNVPIDSINIIAKRPILLFFIGLAFFSNICKLDSIITQLKCF